MTSMANGLTVASMKCMPGHQCPASASCRLFRIGLSVAALVGFGGRPTPAADIESAAPVREVPSLLSQAQARAQWIEQRQQFEWRGDPYGLTGMPVTPGERAAAMDLRWTCASGQLRSRAVPLSRGLRVGSILRGRRPVVSAGGLAGHRCRFRPESADRSRSGRGTLPRVGERKLLQSELY